MPYLKRLTELTILLSSLLTGSGGRSIQFPTF
jgi:hypothetical protein